MQPDPGSIWCQQNVDKFGYVVDVATESDLIDEVVPEIGWPVFVLS
jgi:hypothetical protein